MRITHLIAAESSDSHLIDQHPSRQAMVHDAAPRICTSQGSGAETHLPQASEPTAPPDHDGEGTAHL